MPTHPNPFAALDDNGLLEQIRAMDEHDAAARPDPTYVAHTRELFTLLAAIYGAARIAQAVDDADEEHGGLLVQRPTLWPVESCTDLSGLAADLYQGGGQ